MRRMAGGLISATVVPMSADSSVDEPALRRYIRWVLGQGAAGIAANADTGEPAHLTAQEKVRVLEVIREEVPPDRLLVAGLSGPSTAAAVKQAAEYKAIGADAILVFPIPAFMSQRLDPRVPLNYHREIAKVGLPMIAFQLQPSLGGIIYSPDAARAILDIDEVIAIKEASFDAKQFVELVQLVHESDNPATILTGNDNFIYESMVLGADGALLGFGSIMVAQQVELIRLASEGNYKAAQPLSIPLQRLASYIYRQPIGDYRARLKEALKYIDVLDDATVRAPLVPLSQREIEELKAEVRRAGLHNSAKRSPDAAPSMQGKRFS